jgi:hypothetical protein
VVWLEERRAHVCLHPMGGVGLNRRELRAHGVRQTVSTGCCRCWLGLGILVGDDGEMDASREDLVGSTLGFWQRHERLL